MTPTNTQLTTRPLDATTAWQWLSDTCVEGGAVALFGGQLRAEDGQVEGLFLEHYPGMSEKVLAQLAEQIAGRWPLLRVLAWHRVGAMTPADSIVLVGVSAKHRREAFDACECLMDLVKTRVPLWKKLSGVDGEHWVEAREKDLRAAARWGTDVADEH